MLIVFTGNGAYQGDEQEDVQEFLKKAHLARKGAEHIAKQHIHRLDRSGGPPLTACTASPWEDLSSNSRTAR